MLCCCCHPSKIFFCFLRRCSFSSQGISLLQRRLHTSTEKENLHAVPPTSVHLRAGGSCLRQLLYNLLTLCGHYGWAVVRAFRVLDLEVFNEAMVSFEFRVVIETDELSTSSWNRSLNPRKQILTRITPKCRPPAIEMRPRCDV